jgi:unsaturated chondroitin disaccharide hydrolase
MARWIREADLAAYPELSEAEAAEALRLCAEQTAANLPAFTDRFPGAASSGGYYEPGPNLGWTTGFWTGELWLSYEASLEEQQKAAFRTAAAAEVVSFLRRIETKAEVDHHDMGFLYSPSCVAAYLLTGSEVAKRAAILAADQLIARFQPVGGFIQAWGEMGAKDNYRFIIDCLLNLPLLYWASRETGDPKYRDIAERHIHTAMANVIREDDSTWHTVFMDPVTGAFDHGATCQGYRDGSAWARGQAWGVYGTAVAYKNTKREEYIGYFKRVTTYFLNHLPKDLIPYWDLTFGDGDGVALLTADGERRYTFGNIPGEEPRDSSSAVIVACGMLEMAKYLPSDDAAYYRSIAKKLLKAVTDTCLVTDATKSNGKLMHGTYSHKSPYNTCRPEGTNECVIWGDYYYMEALTRLCRPDWQIYW